jgi:hypothetical protein
MCLKRQLILSHQDASILQRKRLKQRIGDSIGHQITAVSFIVVAAAAVAAVVGVVVVIIGVGVVVGVVALVHYRLKEAAAVVVSEECPHVSTVELLKLLESLEFFSNV